MLSKKQACEIMLIGTLLFAGCAPNVQLEQRVTALEGQLVRPRATAPAPTPHSQAWRQRFDSIPRGSTYPTVVQGVGQPTHIERDGNLALCVYYVNDEEIYVLVFESGVYTQGYVDTYTNWMKVFARGSHRSS